MTIIDEEIAKARKEIMYVDAIDHGERINIDHGIRLHIGCVKVSGRGNNRRVEDLHVYENFRRKGYATRLMNTVIERHGHTNLYLVAKPSREKNAPGLITLMRFYRGLGFDTTDDTNASLRQIKMMRPRNQ
jgi:GNAT superfamily N-acetyltransferase